ncbi:serine/threonine-protein kinase [Nocardia harenae]|uniref:serine/threonine-protein kinase n=1 Tax=Nocardia harenae TaxID=358707 RepID=UPI000832D8B7|nr:serine/threonine-protein kinase [Nocardia harenae]
MNATRWFGEYRLDSVIGRGGMGQVWRAFHQPTQRFVALKVLPAELADDEEFRRRFEREARVAARLSNPHLVAIHSFGRVGDQLYIDMALVDGVDVSALLRERGPMPPVRAVELLAQIGAAVDGAHAAGLVHRDIKPGNILIDRTGFAYLIDFGIAKPDDETGLTSTGASLGTIAYMAPERFEGVAGPAADIYALGCVLAECILGGKIFAGESVAEQIFGHLYKPPPRLGELRPGVPPALDDVLARALAKDPADRFGTATELVDAARRALTDGPVAWNHGTAATVAPATVNWATGAEHTPPPAARFTPPTGHDQRLAATVDAPGIPQAGSAHNHPGAPHTPPAAYYRVQAPAGFDHGTAPAVPGRAPRRTVRRNALLAVTAVLLVFAIAAGVTLALRGGGGTVGDVTVTTGTTTAEPTSGDDPTETTEATGEIPALPDRFAGTWKGRVTDGLAALDIELTLRAGQVGEEVGESSNTGVIFSQTCSRTETLLAASDTEVSLRATLTGGPADCTDDGSVSTLTANPDGSIGYSFPGPLGTTLRGTLTPA